jgi:hypothetical protein
MKKNVGTTDRVIRTLAALVVAYLLFSGIVSGTLGIILGIIAIALLVTGSISFSPGYLPFHISTMKKTEGAKESARSGNN